MSWERVGRRKEQKMIENGLKTNEENRVDEAVSADVITEVDIRNAADRLRKYQEGKKSIDAKATANQEWWRGRHWSQINDKNDPVENNRRPASAWLFNSIINKVADVMDNYPKPNILPRNAMDEDDARQLSDIVPVVLEHNWYERLYTQKSYDFIGDGTAITCVVWDSSKEDGLGDISIKQVDIHNIAWKPGISNLEDSPEVFYISAMETDELLKLYPQMEGHTGNDIQKTEYVHDDSTADQSELNYIVDWYYKVTYQADVEIQPGMTVPKTKTVLHFCKFCNDVILYSSENEGMDEGFYQHGKYPFVIQKCFPIKDSPVGFGYIDVMKDPQTYIDILDQLILKNARQVASSRWFLREDCGFNVEDFNDWSKPFVRFTGSNLEETLKEITAPTMPAFVMNHQINKIDELKETSGNRDFSQGSAAQGVTAASAIAALQEAGSKLSRLVIKSAYSAFTEECYLIIELIKQFYTEPRSFRIDREDGGYEFIEYSSMPVSDEDALRLGITPINSANERRRPVFDIRVIPEKQSPFSRASQNEMAKEMFNMGMFNPQLAEPSLVCLDMMDFEQKDDIKQKIKSNSLMMQQMNQIIQGIQSLEPMLPGVTQMILGGGMGIPMPTAEGPIPKMDNPVTSKTNDEKSKASAESTSVAKARTKAARQSELK